MATNIDPWTSDRSVRRARRTAAASRRTVIIALAANALVAVTKLVGGALSGSAALLAEAVHSIADTTNQAFLLGSIALADRDPTPEQPFGYGRLRFLWTFIAAVFMFLAGAIFAIGYGVYELVHGDDASGFTIAFVILAVDFVAEGTSWLRAVRQTRREAAELGVPLRTYIRESRDPNVKMVLFEDSAALIGLLFAAIGIAAADVLHAPAADAAASIAVGVLLVAVAGLLGRDTSQLLVGASARPAERDALAEVLRSSDAVDRVVELLTMVLGPNSLLVAARLDFADGLDDDGIERASSQIDRRMREAVPDVTEVFLDATTDPSRRRARAAG